MFCIIYGCVVLWTFLNGVCSVTLYREEGTIGPGDALKDPDTICCVRPEWEALMYLDYATVFIDQNTAFAYINGSVKFGYSLSRGKVYIHTDGVMQSPLIPKPVPSNYTILYDFSHGIVYSVVYGECQKTQLEQNMTLQCIPGSAKDISAGVVGNENTGRLVHTYRYTDTGDVPWKITATVLKIDIAPVEPKECDPVTVTYFAPTANPDSGSLYTLNVLDIGDIKSLDMFDIPKECTHL
ncbi:uncharacterized protein LOC128221013 isoform X2 [Mya arenaria]|uniref:uncharacterized protein LOC128221013 isoform X2 n=1 Tax=Mya arenaria TaxID=6604 RepID=UPI0022E49A8B|nr:uncharacterized protein LOC128221013 isoform X2 [Mya arenaria]